MKSEKSYEQQIHQTAVPEYRGSLDAMEQLSAAALEEESRT